MLIMLIFFLDPRGGGSTPPLPPKVPKKINMINMTNIPPVLATFSKKKD